MEQEIITLVEQAKKGSQKAFNSLYKHYRPLIWKTVYNMVRNKDLTDDLTLTIFAKAYTKLDSYVEHISFEMWLKTITINTVIDYIRKYKYEKLNNYIDDENNTIQIEELGSSPEEESIIKEKLNLTLSLIPSLKRVQREILEAKMNGLSYKQISEQLAIDEEQVKTLLNKARQILKRKLDIIYNNKS